MILIEREPASHWYLANGTPFHEVEKKVGLGKRPATLADARKVNALPSVTNVLGVLAKPGLDAWKIEQGIVAALTLPRQTDEPLDSFARRVVTDMGEQVERAAYFGSAVHTACERYARSRELPSVELFPFVEAWRSWFDKNVEEVLELERVYVHQEHGYAGRMDMLARLRGIGVAVVDFKTQKVKRNTLSMPKPAFYEAWPLQLAAYQQAIVATRTLPGGELPALVSVVIDSAHPGPVHVRNWAPCGGPSVGTETGLDYFQSFLSALALWRYVKGYDPRSAADRLRVE